MSKEYNLPDTTAKLVKAYVDEGKDQCKNLSLILDKYPPAYVLGNSQEKSEWLRRLEPNSRVDTVLTQSAYRRWHAMMTAMKAILFNASLEWRMVIGLGGETVLETDLTLHHLYGIPFIPGSALKGLTRAYVTGEVEEHKSEEIDKDDETIKRIFGSQEHAGTVLFFDAMPLNGQVKFVLDIMNPHYPDYYNSSKSNQITPPTNNQNSVPVTFLTVTTTTFTFALAPRNPNDTEHKGDVEAARRWLQEAIEKYGVGGKTSAGYGYFTSFEPKEPLSEKTTVSKTEAPPPQQEPYVRPNIPRFKEGQKIPGIVLDPKKNPDAQRQVESGQASACLRYREFPTKMLLMVISPEYADAKNWSAGNTKNCVFVREEVQGNCTVWICRP